MPYIEAKLSIKLDDKQKNELQTQLTEVISNAFSKPKAYIMTTIEDEKAIFMAGVQPDSAAYISVGMLGTASKTACLSATQGICKTLNTDYGISGSNIYVTFHPTELWGWNGSMF
jgi:phenylpyruvate tautomerase PptA (4-oxalocrotonate tautomerase family)